MDISKNWLDRSTSKSIIRNWIKSSDVYLNIGLNNEIEIFDFTNWLEYSFTGQCNQVFFSNQKFNNLTKFIEDLAFDLGSEKFPNFIKELNKTRSRIRKSNINVDKSIGKEAKAGGDLSFENININDDDIIEALSPDKEINSIFEHFKIEFLKNIKSETLITFVVKDYKYCDIDSNFKSWFENKFIKFILGCSNIKFCVITISKEQSLNNYSNYNLPFLNDFNLKEMLEFTPEYIKTKGCLEFCYGAIGIESESTKYSDYKLKLVNYLKRTEGI